MQPVRRFEMVLILLKELVLPDRIELSTSPLPMECSGLGFLLSWQWLM
jgi:hypothetical protein